MKLQHQPPKAPEVAARRATLATYINALADLAAPKKAMAVLSDAARLEAFDAGIRTALQCKPGTQPHLALTSGRFQTARSMLPAPASATLQAHTWWCWARVRGCCL